MKKACIIIGLILTLALILFALSSNPTVLIIFILTILLLGFATIAAANNERKNQETKNYFFTFNGVTYPAGTVIKVPDLNNSETIDAVYLYFDKETNLHYYEPIIGNQVVHCSNIYLYNNISEITQQKIDIDTLHQDKANYNNYMYSCPMCGNRKISNISTEKKLITMGVVGLASSNLGKNYICNNCKYKW